jgi:ornithine decarboxylase
MNSEADYRPGPRPIRYGGSAGELEHYRRLVAEHGSPLLLLSRKRLAGQYRALQGHLPGVALYYAIKAFPHAAVIETLAGLGCHFDVASEGEIDLLKPLGISGRRTIHTHPVKKPEHIKAALRGGSTTFVVDNHDEMAKLRPFRHRVGVLLRISFRSDSAAVDLSRKFGCAPEQATELVMQAQAMGIHVRGLSFHVGSQSLSPQTHVSAIHRCAALIEDINRRVDNPLSTLDIGGGFPVDYAQAGFDHAAYFAPIRDALSGLPRDWQIIAEPGRFLVAPAVTSVCTISGKARRGDYQWYYLDDGVYGSYSGQLFDHMRYPLQVFNEQGGRQPSILAGPTCDSIDIIAEDVLLPDLQEGDLVIGHMMGAYTAATSTRFNSLNAARIVVID